MHPVILHDHELAGLNTFGLHARASHFAEARSLQDITELLRAAREKGWPLLILGSGSNVLITGNFQGLALRIALRAEEVLEEDANSVTVRVGAGEEWHPFVMRCVERGWGGIENMALIPGCVGAAPIQNIGAYGVEIKDLLVHVDTLDVRTGEPGRFSHDACQFGYRDSIFKGALKGQKVITHVTLRLRKSGHRPDTSYGAIADELRAAGVDPKTPTLSDVAQAVIRIRQSKLPDPKVIGNAGSFFKNPEIQQTQWEALKEQHPGIPGYPVEGGKVKVPAGWLIEQAGWKGRRVGHCGVHDKQALVLVNHGGALGTDILDLSTAIIRDILAKYGIALEREVNVI